MPVWMPLLSLCWALGADPAAAVAPAPLTLEHVLVQGRALQPSLRAAEAGRDAAVARAAQARAGLLPQVSAVAQVQRLTSNYVLRPGSLPNALTPQRRSQSNESFSFLSASAQLSQLLYDFGATPTAFRAAEQEARAQEHNTRAQLLAVDLALRRAFLQAHARQSLAEVAEETLDNAVRHLRQIEAAVQSGTQASIDRVTAEATVATAELDLLTVRNDLMGDKLALGQAMGLDAGIAFSLEEPRVTTTAELEQQTDAHASGPHAAASLVWTEPWVQRALCARPEFDQLAARQKSLEHAERSAWGRLWPSFGVQASFTEQGRQLDAMVYNWSAMGVMNVAAFTGGQQWAQIQEAAANRRALKANARTLEMSVRAAVQTACLALVASKKGSAVAEVALHSAHERLRLAEGRYRAGVGSILELNDAQLLRASAASDRVQADYRLSLARADVLYALGVSS